MATGSSQKTKQSIGQFNRKHYNQWESLREASGKLVPQTEEEHETPSPAFEEYAQFEGKTYAPFGLYEGKPIPSVPNVNQIWPYGSRLIGDEWDDLPQAPGGLEDDQVDRCRSELIQNVTFIKFLKSGGFGAVWEVDADYRCDELSDTWRRLKFAVKVIRPEDASYEGVKTSLDDMLILRYLRHENICNMSDIIGISDSKTGFPYSVVCLFLEYCHGNFTDIYTENKPQGFDNSNQKWTLPEHLSRHWFAQIIRGLDYIHSQNVVHHDIKEPNILFKYTEEPLSDTYEDRFLSVTFKLGDFGCAISYDDSQDDLNGLKAEDIKEVLNILGTSGIPGPTNSEEEFVYYITDCDDSSLDHYRQCWKTVSQDLKDLFAELYFAETPVAEDILKCKWFQNNDEPRTEPFIWRQDFVPDFVPIQFNQQLYEDWEQQRTNPDLHQNYAPFGSAPTNRQRIWDREHQKWIMDRPIQGMAYPPQHTNEPSAEVAESQQMPPIVSQNPSMADLWEMLKSSKTTKF